MYNTLHTKGDNKHNTTDKERTLQTKGDNKYNTTDKWR